MFGRKKIRLMVQIASDKCIRCGKCIDRCRHAALGALYDKDENPLIIGYIDRCTGCGKCIRACEADAIKLIEV